MLRQTGSRLGRLIRPTNSKIHRKLNKANFSAIKGKVFFDLINEKMQEINNEDEILTKFAGEINKAYARDQMLKRKLEEYQETFEGCIWHNDEAIRALLGEYRRSLNEIGYSTEVLVLAFKELAKVYKAKADITQTGYELTGSYLFENSDFQLLLESFRYALLDTIYLSGQDIADILDSLRAVEYKDLDLQRLVQNKLKHHDYYKKCKVAKRSLERDPRILADYPFAGKEGFKLRPRPLDAQQADEKFREYIKRIKDLELSNKIDKKGSKFDLEEDQETDDLEQGGPGEGPMDGQKRENPLKFQKPASMSTPMAPSNIDTQEIGEAMDGLIEVIDHSKEGFAQVLITICKLRDDYYKLTLAQKKDYITANSSILTDLLELEELLLENGVIDILDVLYIAEGQKLDNSAERLAPIFARFLLENNIAPDVAEKVIMESRNAISPMKKHKNAKKAPQKNEGPGAENQYRVGGIYAKELIIALEALGRYATHDVEDVNPKNAYTVPGIDRLVNDRFEELRHARERSDYGLADEVNILSDPEIDVKSANTPSLHYHQSVEEWTQFLEGLWRETNAKNPSLSVEFGEDYEGLFRVNHLLRKSFSNIDLSQQLQRLKPDLKFKQLITEYKPAFDEALKFRKIEILYKLAIYSFDDPVYNRVFKQLWRGFAEDEGNVEDLVNFNQMSLTPLPEYIKYLVLVAIHAENQGLELLPEFYSGFRKLALTRKLGTEVEDRRDPFAKVCKQFFNRIKEKETSDTLQRQIELKILDVLPEELRPFAYIKNYFGENLALYVMSPKDRDFVYVADRLEYSSRFEILSKYFTRLVGYKVHVVCLPYEMFFKVDTAEHLPFYRAKIFELKHNINQEVLRLMMTLLKTRLGDGLGRHIVHDEENQRLGNFSVGMKEAIDTHYPEWPKKFYELGKNYFRVYKTVRFGGLNEGAANVLQNLIFAINKEFKNLEPKIQEKIALCFEVQPEGFEDHLKEISGEIKGQVAKLNQKSVVFEGRRFGLEAVAAGTEEVEELPGIEFVDYNFFRDPEFYSYENWRQIIEDGYDSEVHLFGGRNFNRGLAAYTNAYVPEGEGFSNFLRPSVFSMNWEIYAYSRFQHDYDKKFAIDQVVYNTPSQSIPKMIYNIERLKRTIKTSGDSLKDKMLKIADFDFITNDLTEAHLRRAQEGVVLRKAPLEKDDIDAKIKGKGLKSLPYDFGSFTSTQNRRAGIRIEDNEYRNVVKQEASYLEEVKYWKEILDDKIPKMYTSLKNKKRSIEGLKKFKNHAKKKYFRALRNLDGRRSDKLNSHAVKAVKAKILEVKSQASIFQEKVYYDYHTDPDFVKALRDKSVYMKRKRILAESNLVKFSILTKIVNNEPLTANQTHFLQLWRKAIVDGNKETLLPINETLKSFGELSTADIHNLHNDLGFTFFEGCNEFILNDLIFELGQVINTKLILQFEECLLSTSLLDEWGIELPLGTKRFDGVNNTKKFLLDKIEKVQWKKALMYSEDELRRIKEVFALDRGITDSDRIMLEHDLEGLDEFLGQVNDLENRDELLTHWLKRKYKENARRAKFVIKRLMMNDKNLSKYYREHREQRVDKKLKTIFGKEISEITETDLATFVDNLTRRMYLFKGYLPTSMIYVLFGVLTHPNLSRNSKETLYSCLTFFGIDLNDSLGNQSLAKLPVLIDQDKAIETDKYDNQSSVVELFKNANYNANHIFSNRLVEFKEAAENTHSGEL